MAARGVCHTALSRNLAAPFDCLNRELSTSRVRPGFRAGLLALCAIAFGLLAAAPAVAQDPTSAQYENPVDEVTSESGPTTVTTTPDAGSSAPASAESSEEGSGLEASLVSGLPFTGLDLISLGAVALALVAIGFALRRMTVPRE